MKESIRMVAATMLGAAAAFSLATFGQQAPKKSAYRDTCSEQLGLIFEEVNALNLRLSTQPDLRKSLERDMRKDLDSEALTRIDATLAGVQSSVRHIEVMLQFPATR